MAGEARSEPTWSAAVETGSVPVQGADELDSSPSISKRSPTEHTAGSTPDVESLHPVPRELAPDKGEFWVMVGALARLAIAVGGVALATAALRLAAPHSHLANLAMLYVLVIQATAILAGRVPAIVAAVLSFLALNWYFLHPVGHWTVSDPEEWLVLLMLLVTGLVTGQMAAVLRARAQEARERQREMAMLYELGTATAGQVELEPSLEFLAARVRESFGGAPCEFLLWDRDDRLRPLGLTSVTASGPVTEFPLRSGQRDFGRMRVGRRADGWPHSLGDRRLMNAVARHAALAIERFRLAREAHEARLLRDSDALKSTLLSAVSHDLRTPLAGIKALTTALLQNNMTLPPEIIQEALQGIDEETDRMTRLVADLLDLSRIEAGVLHPSREPVLVPDLIDDTLHRLTARLSGREIRREVEMDLPVANLDYVQMQQVLTNLLENAARYSYSGTPISVGARALDGALEMWVADHGPGIPSDQRERIFDRFYRLEHHETEQHGTGMGLAISRGLVEAHGGRLWVEETPGGGATFRMALPGAWLCTDAEEGIQGNAHEQRAAEANPGDR
jgi:two-component system sensor histidine kinase KdpD